MLPPSTRARSSPQAAGVPSTMTRAPPWVPVSRSLPWVLLGDLLGTFSMGSETEENFVNAVSFFSNEDPAGSSHQNMGPLRS
ncbi:hypothetical protein AMECASPLE_030023 [Ameca splendens]|uniref:Uncharacterized protein n=1 Tax=Ameca splendens TaxID=208324 RepID=A0ABV0ZFM6_9TELE